MNARMRAVMYFAPKNIQLVEMPTPRPGPGQVLLKVGAALTCGTDFKAYRQGHKVLLAKTPSPFGHELAGTVVETGEGVTDFRPGDRVVAANSAPCDRCYFCERGQNQLCDHLDLHNGAYADYNLVPSQIVRHNLWKLPDTLGFAQAALAEPLACAIHAVDVLGVRAGERVAIIGAGSMAVLLIQALVARQAHVIVAGRGRDNLAIALRAGAHEAYSSLDGDIVDFLKNVTGGRGADCVFEAVGKTATWQQALAMVRKGGRVCLFGGCAAGTVVPVDAHRVHYGQISLHGVFHHTPRYFKAAVDLLATGKIASQLLIARTILLADVPRFFDEMHATSNQKVAVVPE